MRKRILLQKLLIEGIFENSKNCISLLLTLASIESQIPIDAVYPLYYCDVVT